MASESTRAVGAHSYRLEACAMTSELPLSLGNHSERFRIAGKSLRNVIGNTSEQPRWTRAVETFRMIYDYRGLMNRQRGQNCVQMLTKTYKGLKPAWRAARPGVRRAPVPNLKFECCNYVVADGYQQFPFSFTIILTPVQQRYVIRVKISPTAFSSSYRTLWMKHSAPFPSRHPFR